MLFAKRTAPLLWSRVRNPSGLAIRIWLMTKSVIATPAAYTGSAAGSTMACLILPRLKLILPSAFVAHGTLMV